MLVDGSLYQAGDTIDSILSSDKGDAMFIATLRSTVALYSNDESEYYVGLANTMYGDSKASVKDHMFAMNNENGEVIEGCVYDNNTGLAYIPKSFFKADDKVIAGNVQIQFLQVINQKSKTIKSEVEYVTTDGDEVKTGDKNVEAFDFETKVQTEKGLMHSEFTVSVNGVPVSDEGYTYEEWKMVNETKKIMEDSSIKEQTVYYDVRVNASAPGDSKPIQLIINVEAQLDTAPGYPIEKRAIYYCCRLISAQYGTVFNHSEYGKIRKVYSIWFCPNSAQKRENTIKKISLEESSMYGDIESRKSDTDLLQAIIVNMGDPDQQVDNQILRLMNVLLSNKKDVQTKQKVMQDEFHIAMTMELESEVSELCNLSQGIYNEGLDKGIEGAVALLRKAGLEDKVIVENIMEQYHLPLEVAQKYVLLPTAG